MRLSLLLFLTLSIANSQKDHWKQLLWENGIKVLSESENPYNLLSQVVHAIESEDDSVNIEPVINEVLTRIVVMNSDKSRQGTHQPGKKGSTRLFGDFDTTDKNLKTGVVNTYQNLENIAGIVNNSFADGADNVVNWLKSTQKRVNQFANVTLNQTDSVGYNPRGDTSHPGFLNLRRGDGFFGQIIESFLKPGGS